MRELCGNIWDFRLTAIIAITTNGQVSRSGKAVMGRGVAAQAARMFPEIPALLAQRIVEQGNHVHYLGDNIVSFPVEHSPYQVPDLKLIERSARELVELANHRGWQSIVVPRPGCGGGGLSWEDVKPILESCFDERFTVITAVQVDNYEGAVSP
ncbi:MAG: ADP-ribose-binding protein [Desulfuromonadales bacterium]|nr:ADP-ribose-binding protein [Desulfuromonadales bacterium]